MSVNEIAVILYDDLPISCNSIRDNLKDFTRFKITGGPHNFKIFETQNLNETLTKISDQNFSWAVVVAVGNFISNQSVIFNTIDYAVKQQASLVGDSYFFALDLTTQPKEIISIPIEIQDYKKYCYPHRNYNELIKLIIDPKCQLNDPQLTEFIQEVNQAFTNLERGYYVLNTELFNANLIKDKQFDCFIGVCGGLKPSCIIGKYDFAVNSNIYLFDISQAAINWQKYLLGNWDGDLTKFEEVFNQFQTNNPNYIPIYHSHRSINENINWFLTSVGFNNNEFKQVWKKYSSMQIKFISLDLLADDAVDQIITWSQGSKLGNYIWISNSFEMDYLMFYKTNKQSQEKFYKFKKNLIEKSNVFTILE
jgi:hypothetical protein